MLAAAAQDYKVLRRRDWTSITAVAAIAGGLGALTYAYAWARTGNPIFPLMNDIFHSPYWPRVAFYDHRYVGHLAPGMLYGMTFDTGHYLEAWPGALGFVFIALQATGVGRPWCHRHRLHCWRCWWLDSMAR